MTLSFMRVLNNNYAEIRFRKQMFPLPTGLTMHFQAAELYRLFIAVWFAGPVEFGSYLAQSIQFIHLFTWEAIHISTSMQCKTLLNRNANDDFEWQHRNQSSIYFTFAELIGISWYLCQLQYSFRYLVIFVALPDCSIWKVIKIPLLDFNTRIETFYLFWEGSQFGSNCWFKKTTQSLTNLMPLRL